MEKTEPYRVSVKLGAVPTSTFVVPAAKRTEFERFEDLTARLLTVPKSEIDAKRKA
jgi:hypothetical protein